MVGEGGGRGDEEGDLVVRIGGEGECGACCVYPLRGILMSLSSLLNCFVGLMCLTTREVYRKLIFLRVSMGGLQFLKYI